MDLTPEQEMSISIRLSLQHARLGEIGPNLRAVTCSWNGDQVRIRAIFDGPIDEEDEDSFAGAVTGVVSDLPSDWNGELEDEIVRIDASQPYRDQILDHWVYIRREAKAYTKGPLA